VIPAPQDPKALQDYREYKAQLVLQAQLVLPELKDLLDLKDLPEQLEQLEQPVQLVQLARKDPLDHKDLQEPPVLKARKALKDQQVQPT
jgi:hypothetical protein